MASSSWTRLAALRRRLPYEFQVLSIPKHSISRYTETLSCSSRFQSSSASSSSSSSPLSTLLNQSIVSKDIPIWKALSTQFEDLISNSIWLIPRKNTGFDNFLPNNKRKNDDDDETQSTEKENNSPENNNNNNEDPSADEKPSKKKDEDEDVTKKWTSGGFGPFRSQHDYYDGGDGGRGGGGGGGGPYISNSFALFLLILTYIMMPSQSDDGSSPGDVASREITWSEFCNHLLETGQVDKIVVTNNRATAKVFLKPGAPGLPFQPQSRQVRYSERRQQAAAAIDNHHSIDQHGNFDDTTSTTTMSDDFSTNTTTSDSLGMSSTRGGQAQHQLVYRFAIGNVEAFEKKLEEAQRAVGMDPSKDIPVQYTAESTIATEIFSVTPSLLLMGAAFYFIRFGLGGAGQAGRGGGMGGIFQIGKSTAKKISKEDVKINFKHVAGCEEAKKEIMEFVDFLQDPSRFTKLGAKIPKGALLCGPPGTGKTLLAKAVAGEAGVPFYSISGSDFIEMFVGVGPSRVRDLFRDARENSPCIIFIDEIDAVGRQRGRGGVGGNDERENTLNQLLVEMDGFDTQTGVVVLAGTNRVDILDQALTRPGRFDRQITVDKPDLQGRKEIFKVHLKGITLEDSMDDVASRLAGLTPGFAGADIANICNESAIVAARRKADAVSMDDFEKATDRIIGGLESNKIMSKEERSIVAHHEAGHAIAGWFLEHADPLLKVTIVPRTSGALGFAQYLPKEVFLRTEEQIMDIVCMALAGRAAEEIFFGRVTTGASDDLRRVTDLVYSTIQVYGMNPRLGQLAFPKDPNAMFDERQYSEKTAKAMDEEAKVIVDEAYQRTLNLLREHKDAVEKVAGLLLEKETITHDDIVELVGPRPFIGDSAYEEFIHRRKQVKEDIEQDLQNNSAEGDDNKKDGDKSDGSGDPLNPGLA